MLRFFAQEAGIHAPEVSIVAKAMPRNKSQLNQREAMVIAMRFGLMGNTDHTLEEIGQQLGVTRERVRQIEAKALHKLRRNETLSSFWES